ncbi:MAG TPA: bi-domain-containing oxidoreductase [Solirubrobacteraceae bacterium]|nr:bi-domain-containing oxidoreductase [Solirubrobacteraceae bacterium]
MTDVTSTRPSHPPTKAMKQVLQVPQNGRTVVRTVPRPPCPPGGVLVHNAYSAISSGTERARVELSRKSLVGKARERPDLVREVWRRSRSQGVRATMRVVQQRLSQETPVGYSCAGTVVEVGEHVRGLLPGDLVACAGGAANHAEFVAVPGNLCARVPPDVPLASAAITTIASVALHGIRLLEAQVGSRVAVIGCGLVGQIALRLLRAAGIEALAIDIDPQRIAQVRAAGAEHAIVFDDTAAERVRSVTGAGVDGVLVAAASKVSDPLLLGCEIARDRGAIVLVGAVPIELPRAALYDKELRFRVSRSYGPGRYDAEYEERGLDYPAGYVPWTEKRNMETVLRLQARRLVSFTDLVELVPVENAPGAYSRLTAAKDAGPPPAGALVLSYAFPDRPTPPPNDGVSARPVGRARKKRGTGRTPVRVGLIGPGGFAGRALIPELKRAGADLVLVGGGNGPSAAAAVRTGAFRRTAASTDEVINDPQIDAVVICTRHGDHAALASDALRAGKHVFCEKPLALTTDEHQHVLEAARAAPGTLMVGFNRRFSAPLRQMRDFLAAPGSPMTLGYRVSAGAVASEHWVHDLATGGGRALGEGCHFIDSLSFLAGSPVVEIHACGHGPQARPVQAYDNLAVTLRFADHGVASLVYVADGSPRVPKERIEGFCATRTAILNDYSRLELHDGEHATRSRRSQPDKGHSQEMVEFLAAVRSGHPAQSLDEIGNVMLATLAVVESLRTQRPVHIPC